MKSDLASLLLPWYDANRRHMPWREDPTPYHVYLSEIMLQQTRVEAVRAYYARFLDALPTLKDLSEVEDDALMKLWQGLGYYSRARNLKKAAIEIMDHFGGDIPSSAEALRTLPGIGDYTSAAISAFAFQKKEVPVDGNLIRVYARLEAKKIDPKAPSSKDDCRAYFSPKLPEDRPGDFGQALMDLGEMVCLPSGAPFCGQCPFASLCSAHAKGIELQCPASSKPLPKKQIDRTVFRFVYQNKIGIRKRPAKGLLAGLYELPALDEKLDGLGVESYLESKGISYSSIAYRTHAKHVFSHLVWEMDCYDVVLNAPIEGIIFATEEELTSLYSVPSAFQMFIK